MQASDFRQARELARRNGVKSLVYGPPGSGKTPVINTAPSPCLLSCEPGLLSMTTSTVPTYEAHTCARIDEFFKWLQTSNERKNYHTAGIDSATEMGSIFLRENMKKILHGQQLYGAMAEWVYPKLQWLYNAPQLHTYIICKQMIEETDAGKKLVPGFPGKSLNADVPFLYDLIMHLDIQSVPNYGNVRAFHCHSGFGVSCRDRTGQLAEFEPPDLAAIFNKCMQQ